MPGQFQRPECAAAYRLALTAGELYLPDSPLITWKPEHGGATARLPIEGTPEDPATGKPIVAFVSLHLGTLIPLLSISTIWDRERIYGIDMGGGTPHRNARGRPMWPPHRHFYGLDGVKDCEAIDLAASRISAYDDHSGIVHHFFDWSGLDGSAVQWQNPPGLQGSFLAGIPAKY